MQLATAAQAATRARLRVLGDADTCAEARFVAYRRSAVETEFVDQWYVASQLWADAALLMTKRSWPGDLESVVRRLVPVPATGSLVPLGEPEDHCHLAKGFIFLDRLYDHEGGGYYPRSDPTGLKVDTGARYGDDNALAGLALLAAMETTSDAGQRTRYLHAARREADFLLTSGLWDETFGGGFWWNTGRGDSAEGKPAQTNALAALFFGRLFAATGDARYRTQALDTLVWLDTILYDPDRQLYRWSVSYEAPAQRTGPAVVAQRYFNYDQSLAIEAQLLVAGLDNDPGRLRRARQVGKAVQDVFWNREHGGYDLEAGNPQVYASYGAWTSLGHLALYDVDGDRTWLAMAEANAQALTSALSDARGSYALQHYGCISRADLLGCESSEIPWVIDWTLDTAAQAWTQHLNVALGRRLALASGPPRTAPSQNSTPRSGAP
ncbi:MAG: AGE family epimerase/isomerase [Gemmataceae bacterium]|nr:AGE family epimerase/isomerase [Gemmataceae bacterium]